MAAKSVPIKRRNHSNPQIKSYTEAVRRGQRSYHVVHSEGKWEVKRIGGDSVGAFRTADEATHRAREVAKKERTEVFIHSRNGLIRERNSYIDDSRSPKD